MSDTIVQFDFDDAWTNTSGRYSGSLTVDYGLQKLSGTLSVTSPFGDPVFTIPPPGLTLTEYFNGGSPTQYVISLFDSDPTQSVTLSWFGNEPTTFVSVQYFSPDYPNGPQLGSSFEENGGITATPACYCPGTLIMTPHGEVAIEDLRIGDQVLTAGGGPETIGWIGRRSYDGRFIGNNHLMWPVTIKAGALADGVPHTDLAVSPGHAMFVDGHLVPAWRLINGVSVVQAGAMARVTYVHVELDHHHLILANGAAAESLLGGAAFRAPFHNAAEFSALYPDARPMLPLQTRLEDGLALQCIQDRLARRAGIIPPVEPAGPLRGYVDQVQPARACGWAQDVDSPEEPVALEVSVGGTPVLCLLANSYRADLRQAGFGSGCHAFDMALPDGSRGRVEVRRVTDGAKLAPTEAAQAQSRGLAA